MSDRGWEGVARLGEWISVISDHERNGAGRVSRGSPMDSIMSNKLGRVSRAGFVVSRLLRS